jgi:peptidoglycan/xylan/chitin deacetylase (PgdA/CDA1 family)
MIIVLTAIAFVLISIISTIHIASAAGTLKVQMYNSGTAASTNSIGPVIRLTNQGTTAITLSTVTIRYYYTVDGDKAQNYYCDYAVMNPGNTVETSNITGKFVKLAAPVTGADYYLELGFTSAAGTLAAGSTVDIQSRFAKTDWSNYTQTGDHSFNSSATSLVDWNYIMAYVSGTLAWGTEPGGSTPAPTAIVTPSPTVTLTPAVTPSPTLTATPIRTATATRTATPNRTATPVRTATSTPTPTRTATPTPTVPPATATPTGNPGAITVLYKCGDINASVSSITFSVQIQNNGSSAISLSTVKVRYWFTGDGSQGLAFSCDYAQLGSGNITGNFLKLTTTGTTADTYFEMGFASGAGSLAAGANTGDISIRIYRTNYTSLTQSNDYSFNSSLTAYGQNTKVTGYVNGARAFGTEPLLNVTPVPTATPYPFSPTPTTGISGLPIPGGSSSLPKPSGAQGGLSVVNWAGFTSAVSYTFDDSNQSQIDNYAALNALGVHMTFYLVSSSPNSSNSIWAQAVKDGHELGNHTQTHASTASAAEIDNCTTFIQQTYGVTVYTMAAPYGDMSYATASQTKFLANRGVWGGSIAPNDSTDPFNLLCNIPAAGAPASDINSPILSARSLGNWQIMLCHGFASSDYLPVDIGQFTSSVIAIKVLGDMWMDSVVNICAYWRAQKLFSTLTPTTSGTDMIYTWTLPAHFPPGKYLRVKVTGGTVKQSGKTLTWDGHGYYEISLDAGSLTISP